VSRGAASRAAERGWRIGGGAQSRVQLKYEKKDVTMYAATAANRADWNSHQPGTS